MPPKKRTLDDFYSTFLMHNIKREELKQSQVYNMYEKPKPDKGLSMPHYEAPDKGNVYQADVLFMPEDPETKEKYILVVVDMATKQTDAIGLKDKTAEAVITGFKKIFKGKVLNEPRYLVQFDNGGEFTAQKTKDYFTGLGVELRFGKPYRSRMQALAEAKNKIIGKALFMRMTANELETGEQDTEWSQFLKPLLTELNKHIKETNKAKEAKEKKLEEKNDLTKDQPHITDKTILLQVGQKVRTILDKPRSATGEKLSGTFRATDIRWDPTIKVITNVILSPRSPPLYQVDHQQNPAYTYNQLQTVDDDQEKKTYIKEGKYKVEKILEKRKKGKLYEYLIKWEGYEKPDWQPAKNLKDVQQMVDDFNKKNARPKRT